MTLAAGRGRRFQPLSAVQPKVLYPICNKPLVQYQLEALRAAGITEVAVVVGAGGTAVADWLGDGRALGLRIHYGDGRALGLRIHYVEDPAPAGIARSLAGVEQWVRGPFAVFLGDVFLAMEGLDPTLTPVVEGAEGVLVVRRDSPEAIRRNFADVADDRGPVSRVVEKPERPPTDLKGCGAYLFGGAIFAAIRQTRPSALRNDYELTDAVQVLIEMGQPVYAVEIARWDVNVNLDRQFFSDPAVGNAARSAGQGTLRSAEPASLPGAVATREQ
jgi:dTDP-glucose pyrophosphorylase